MQHVLLMNDTEAIDGQLDANPIKLGKRKQQATPYLCCTAWTATPRRVLARRKGTVTVNAYNTHLVLLMFSDTSMFSYTCTNISVH